MPATEQLTVTLPTDIADLVRSRMASGKYANESAVIEEALIDTILQPINQDELTRWMNTEGARRLEGMHADPSIGLTVDEAFAGLIDEEPGQER